MGGNEIKGGHPPLGALRERIEGAQGVDLIAEQLDPQGQRLIGRKDVENAPPAAEGTRLLDGAAMAIAGVQPRLQQVVEDNPLADTQRPQLSPQGGWRDRLLHQGAGRSHHQRRVTVAVPSLPGGHGCQHPDALANGVSSPCHPLVRQGVRIGQAENSLRKRGPYPDLLDEGLCVVGAGNQYQHRLAGASM